MPISEEEVDPQEVEEKETEKTKAEEKKPFEFKDTATGKAGDELYPDAEQTDVKTQLINKKILVKEFAELHSSQYDNDYLVVHAELDSKEISFAIGSNAVISKLKKLEKDGNLPCFVTIIKVEGKNNNYYNIE